jgi:hypothetical protein
VYWFEKCGQLRRRLTCGLDTFGSVSLGRLLVLCYTLTRRDTQIFRVITPDHTVYFEFSLYEMLTGESGEQTFMFRARPDPSCDSEGVKMHLH